MGGFGSFDGLEVAELGVSCCGVGVGGLELFSPAVGFVNSFQRVVRSGVHQAFDFGEGREQGVLASIVVVSAERADENHWWSWLGEGVSWGEEIRQFLSMSVSPGQSASCQRGPGLSLGGEGGRKAITMGAWSDPVQGRDNVSQERKQGTYVG